MRDFATTHPSIELRLSASRHLVDFQAEGIDAAIRYGAGGWTNVAAEPLATERIFPVCSPGYAAGLHLRAPEDLGRATLLHNDVPDGWREWFAAAGRPDVFTDKNVYLDEDAALLRAAAEGEGMALGRSVLVAGDLARGGSSRRSTSALPRRTPIGSSRRATRRDAARSSWFANGWSRNLPRRRGPDDGGLVRGDRPGDTDEAAVVAQAVEVGVTVGQARWFQP